MSAPTRPLEANKVGPVENANYLSRREAITGLAQEVDWMPKVGSPGSPTRSLMSQGCWKPSRIESVRFGHSNCKRVARAA